MKKLRFRYSMLLFFAAAIFLAVGLCSQTLRAETRQAASRLVRQGDVDGFISGVDTASKKLRYKNELIDLWSLWYRLTCTRQVVKEDATVVRLDNDFLAFTPAVADAETLAEMADSCARLKSAADGLDIPFLYVMAPNKYSLSGEENNPVRDNLLALTEQLAAREIPVLNLMDSMEAQGLSMEDCYFHTDHHWLPQTGLWAAGELCRALPQIPLDTETLAADRYQTQVYPQFFLGSEGKKVGRYFTPLGLDDFPLLTPDFPTELTVTDRLGTRTGSFDGTLLVKSFLQIEDIYQGTPYTTYTGGDFPLQVIENHRQEDGPRVLVLRDSYSCVVTPFLALAAGEIHTIDVRYWKGVDGAETVADYVRLIRPDAVVVLYAGVSPHMFAFD